MLILLLLLSSEMEGCEIPYKLFGYNTLLDFIRESGEFDWYSTNEGMQIHARVSQNSQHIVSLVGSQNRDRRKKSTKSMPFRPQFNPRQVCISNLVLFVLFPILTFAVEFQMKTFAVLADSLRSRL